MTKVPLGKAAQATRAVSAGISPTGSGRKLMDHSYAGWQTEFADGIYVSSTYQLQPALPRRRRRRSSARAGVIPDLVDRNLSQRRGFAGVKYRNAGSAL